jgi:glycosyltransferase involved in cell wall biosynthesis
VVDDGSTDGTVSALKQAKEKLPELVIVRLAANSGQTAAFHAGFACARGDTIVTLDADLQNDPADIPKLLALLDRWDVVCGYRGKRMDSPLRRLSSRIANATRNKLTGDSIRDVGCSLRAFKAECVRGLKLYEGMHRFLPTLLKMDGWTVTEMAVNHRPRARGKSKYGVTNRLFKAARDLMAVRWMQARRLKYEIAEKLE